MEMCENSIMRDGYRFGVHIYHRKLMSAWESPTRFLYYKYVGSDIDNINKVDEFAS